MPAGQQIAPISPKSTSSSKNSTKNLLNSFQLKPFDTTAKRTTLVENDSLSSYSLPDETSDKGRRQSEEKAAVGATEDLSEDMAKVVGQNKSGDPENMHYKGFVSISIDNSKDDGLHQELTYIQAYMKFMYWTCVCPFDPMKNDEVDAVKTFPARVLNFLQKVCFSIIASLSILQSCLEVKYNFLANFSDGNLETFIDMSYFILNVVTKTYYVYLLAKKQWKFVRMFSSMKNLNAFKMTNSTMYKPFKSPLLYTTILGTSSIVVCIMHIIWTVGFMEWALQKTVQHHFKVITTDIFVWSLHEYENGTVVEDFVKENGNGLTPTKTFLGGLRMFMMVCSGLQIDALTNMMLTNADTIYKIARDLEVKICKPEDDIENITLYEFLAEDGDWAQFKLLKQALNDDNDALDSLLKYKHANNLMLFVYFVLNVFEWEFSLMYGVRLVYTITRVSYTYRIATQASTLNDAERKWVRRLAWKTKDKGFLERVPLILDELEKEPVGMGKGQFLIDESFLYRFIGSVGSVFVLQAQSREANTE